MCSNYHRVQLNGAECTGMQSARDKCFNIILLNCVVSIYHKFNHDHPQPTIVDLANY